VNFTKGLELGDGTRINENGGNERSTDHDHVNSPPRPFSAPDPYYCPFFSR
jgi:hypothetical protein